MASTALHYYTYLAKNPAFPSSLYCSTLTPWPLPYFTALHSTTILHSHCLVLSAPLSSTSYYYATIHKCSLSFQPAYSTTTICNKAIHLAASTTSYYYAIMPSAPHAMVDNVNHKQYFSQVSTAPHCHSDFPYSSPLLAIAAPWVRIALF